MVMAEGCSQKENSGKPSSCGKTLEVLVIVPDNVYKGELQDSINAYFAKQCQGLNQSEPMFDIVQLNPAVFYKSDMFQKHRNIIIISLNDTNKNKLYQYTDYKATPQNYFEFSMNDKDSLYSFIRRSSQMIIEKFLNNEYKRIGKAFEKMKNVKVLNAVKKQFRFELTVSEDFYLATSKPDLIWIRKEPKDASLGIIIYKQPCNSNDTITKEKVIALRDKVTQENIPGTNRGNFMGVEKRFEISDKNIMLNKGVQVLETRGLWKMMQNSEAHFKDFMGGAFVNYCFFDEKKENIIMIDCFIFSPKDSKRDQLIQLESVVRNINFNRYSNE